MITANTGNLRPGSGRYQECLDNTTDLVNVMLCLYKTTAAVTSYDMLRCNCSNILTSYG